MPWEIGVNATSSDVNGLRIVSERKDLPYLVVAVPLAKTQETYRIIRRIGPMLAHQPYVPIAEMDYDLQAHDMCKELNKAFQYGEDNGMKLATRGSAGVPG